MPIALVVAATVLTHTAFNGGRLAISLTALAAGATPLTVGLLLSLIAALPMVLAVHVGRLVDRIGVRHPILCGVALLGLSVSIPAAFPAMPALYVAAAGSGVGFMLFYISIQHAVGEAASEAKRRDDFGWLSLGFSISNFLGPTVAGFTIDALGHRAAFATLALFALASLAVLVTRRGRLRHSPHRPHDGAERSALQLLANAELRRVFVVTGLLASAWDLFTFAVPVYGNSIHLAAFTIGLILASFAAATFLVRLALPWLSRHLREWTLITATFCIASVAYACFPMVSTVPLLALISFLLGLGLGATQPSILALIYAKAPPGRGAEAVGLRSVVLGASSTFLPLAFGGAGEAVGMLPVFWAMATALAGGGLLANRRRAAGPS
ncbi:MAG TPA: MFS transporter [Usitatibacter sp.]|nr:MFS transporter [Usitatibacter sp.]